MTTLSFPIDNPPTLELSCPRGGEHSMSNRERLYEIANTVDDTTLAALVAMVDNYLYQVSEAADDAYCQQLLRESRERGDENEPTVSLEEVMAEAGLTKNDL